MTGTILAIDLGKYKSVACAYRSGAEPAFRAVDSDPDRLLRQVGPGVIVIEACGLCRRRPAGCRRASTAAARR